MNHIVLLGCLMMVASVSCKNHSKDIKSINESLSVSSYDDIKSAYMNDVCRVQTEYRFKLANYVKDHTDRIEVFEFPDVIHILDNDDLYLMDGESQDYIPLDEDDRFEVVPYNSKVFYKTKITIDKESLGELPVIISNIIRSEASKSVEIAYKPTHGIILYSNNNVIFNTAISQTDPYCYVCYPGYSDDSEIVTGYLSIDASKINEFLSVVKRHNQ